MLQIRGMKVRIYPNKTQQNKIDTTLNCCRYIYNEMLARNKKVYERRGEHLNYYAMQNLLPVMKMYNLWLKDADSKALQYSCRQIDTAFQKFFRHGECQTLPFKGTELEPATNCFKRSLTKRPLENRDKDLVKFGQKLAATSGFREY